MENNTEQQVKNFDDLYRYSKERTDLVFCISEFIDNSIASFSEPKYSYRWRENKEKLEITIEYHYQDNKIQNSFYLIKDNANGMTKECLMNALKTGKNNPVHNKLNQYGIGLKLGMFYIGNENRIFSKEINNDEIYAYYHVTGHPEKYKKNQINGSDAVSVTCNISDKYNVKYESGTTISIENLNNSRSLYNDNDKTENLDKLESFLSTRYKKYLRAENDLFKMSIKIKIFNDKKNSAEIEKDLSGNDPFKRENVFTLDKCNINNNLEAIKNKIFLKQNDNDFVVSNKYKNLLQNLLDNSPLIINDEIQIEWYDEEEEEHLRHKIPIKISFLQKANKLFSCVGILHQDRYIYQPVENDKISKIINNPFRWKQKNYEKCNCLWLYGEIDISRIDWNTNCKYIFPDTNKQILQFSNEKIKEQICISLEDKWKEYENFISFLQEITKQKNELEIAKINVSEIEKHENLFAHNDIEKYSDEDSCWYEIKGIKDKIIRYKINDDQELFVETSKRYDEQRNKDIHEYIFSTKNFQISNKNQEMIINFLHFFIYLKEYPKFLIDSEEDNWENQINNLFKERQNN